MKDAVELEYVPGIPVHCAAYVPRDEVMKWAQPFVLIKESFTKPLPRAMPAIIPESGASETTTSEAEVVVTLAPVGVKLIGWLFKQAA